jgi:hypothetical protein
MKYATLLALGLISTVNTIDFDGDGIDDTPEDAEDEEDEGMWGGEDEWYEEDQYDEFNFDDFEMTKRFTMLAAMNANMTADTDGTDELGLFRVEHYNNDVFVDYLFEMDLSNDTTSYVSGWSETFKNNVESYDFVAEDNCYLRFYLEEIDTDPDDSTATVSSVCNVDVPCANTPFAYAPCWL